jgi:photosystem II stability/assembly factor-like uncharacterized protein
MFRSRAAIIILLLAACFQAANANWIKQNTNSFAWYKDIFFLDDRNGWIVGADGVILITTDGGNTWTQSRKFTNDTFIQVHFTDPLNGWMLCERSFFLKGREPANYLRKTTDGGLTWFKVEFDGADHQRVTRLMFGKDGSARAFGEGGVFYDLQEDGTTWKRSRTAIKYLLLNGAFADNVLGAIVGAGGTIMFTEDGGFTWEKASLIGESDSKFNSIFFYGREAWAVGNRGRVFRSNGGARLWRQQDSTVTANLNDVYFTSPANGWAVGDNGIIIRTRDGGANWADEKPLVTHKLEKITFAGGRGWAVGFGGTILTYDANRGPQDPGMRPILMRRG